MTKRGPDGHGVWQDGTVGFAHRRLAVIDLDHRADQPMHRGPLHLVFNGEIYNYRELRAELEQLGQEFTTESDTEVLLHAWAAWGEQALDRLNGMFAFAVWDDRVDTLWLARDAFGEKPLLFLERDGRIVFGSDIQALVEAEPSCAAPDDTAVAAFLAWGIMPPSDASFFKDVRVLPAAHLLRWHAGRSTVSSWWEPRRVPVPADFDAAAAHLRDLLTDAIRLRLRSDVPVGTSLSGGIDSSAIVSLSAELAGDHRRHAFTAVFPGFARDERRYAEEVARAAGVIEHHLVEPAADDFLANLELVAQDQQEPYQSASIYAQWCVMEAAHEAGVTVLLDGQGADEILAGYPATVGSALRSLGARAMVKAAAHADTRTPLARALVADHIPARLARTRRRAIASRYAGPTIVNTALDAPWPSAHGIGERDPLRRELIAQVRVTSLPTLLRYADRSSMAHSREVRLPFLDRRVAEYALSMPAEFLYRAGQTKAVLRRAVRGTVPDNVLDRRDKVGFEPPQAAWLQDPGFKARAAEVLLDSRARARGLYDTTAIEADLRDGAWSDQQAIWRAISLELWLNTVARPSRVAPR